jgi:hypothetical protein
MFADMKGVLALLALLTLPAQAQDRAQAFIAAMKFDPASELKKCEQLPGVGGDGAFERDHCQSGVVVALDRHIRTLIDFLRVQETRRALDMTPENAKAVMERAARVVPEAAYQACSYGALPTAVDRECQARFFALWLNSLRQAVKKN